MDAVALATGNDWRALEAGVDAYAARSGHYQVISNWHYQCNCLKAELIVPISVGTVGGVIKLNPMTKMLLKIMKVTSASDLARIIVAIGLIQKLGAVLALVTDGIVKGHMNLHISNLILKVGCESEKEIMKLYSNFTVYLN